MKGWLSTGLVFTFFAGLAHAQDKGPDDSSHRVQMVEAEPGVSLEVLDWGGTGRAIIFLAGMGDTAHVFDQLAPKLTGQGHIYGITRRGFGASSVPLPPSFDVNLRPDKNYEITRRNPSETNAYDADRLGDDVLAVIHKLKLEGPILIGHSLGGQELSSVGSRHPEKITGLIYLDAFSFYAFFAGPEDELPFKAPHAWPIGPRLLPVTTLAVFTGVRKYTSVPVPVLGIVPFPRVHPPGPGADPAALARHLAAEATEKGRYESLEHALPNAHIVRLPYADHYIWRTNEAEVLQEIRVFISDHR